LEACGVEWLWTDRFALGKFGLIAGLPDMGKGQIAAFIVAAVTAAGELPCGEGGTTQGHGIWLNAQDRVQDTVVPRLMAAGANMDRVRLVNAVRTPDHDPTFSLVTALGLLEAAIEEMGNVVPVIIAPVSAYLGVGKVDGRAATDGSGVLTPLTDMIERL